MTNHLLCVFIFVLPVYIYCFFLFSHFLFYHCVVGLIFTFRIEAFNWYMYCSHNVSSKKKTKPKTLLAPRSWWDFLLSFWKLISFNLFFKVYQFSCSVMSDSLQPHGLKHARLPCPSPTPGAYSNSYPSSPWCHPNISSNLSQLMFVFDIKCDHFIFMQILNFSILYI